MRQETTARDHYEEADIAEVYGSRSNVLTAEAAWLERFGDRIDGREVIDIGCGGGRSSAWLAPRVARYVGLDYAARMIDICRERFPSLDFVQGDATTLEGFDDDSFDVALFSYNGLDTMSQPMRLACLDAIARVLRPQGLFIFSSHNREFTGRVRAFDTRAGFSPRAIRRNLRFLRSFLAVRKLEVVDEEYAIYSDPCAGAQQLCYVISKRAQVRQLASKGFEVLAVFDWDGREVDVDTPDASSMSFYYVCRLGAEDAHAAAEH